MDGYSSCNLTICQHFDQAGLLCNTQCNQLVEGKLFIRGSCDQADAVQPEYCVLLAEDISKATLWQAAVQRHLAALKTTHRARARTRTLALMSTGRGLTHTRSHTTTNTLLVAVCALGRFQIR